MNDLSKGGLSPNRGYESWYVDCRGCPREGIVKVRGTSSEIRFRCNRCGTITHSDRLAVEEAKDDC